MLTYKVERKWPSNWYVVLNFWQFDIYTFSYCALFVIGGWIDLWVGENVSLVRCN